MAEGDGRTEQQEEREEKGQEEGELEDGRKEEGVEQRRRNKRGKEVEIPRTNYHRETKFRRYPKTFLKNFAESFFVILQNFAEI